jgi:vancomycin permeability regulator SanA
MAVRKRSLALSLFLSPLIVLFGASVAIVFAGLNDHLHAADLGVVLGSKVNRDGRPSVMLQARLDHAIELYREGYFKLVLVSGGHGKEGYDEAVVMAQYLEAHGVPSDAILEDHDGTTTWMTARNTAQIMAGRHCKSVLVVSQYFHMARCRLAFEKFGVSPVYTSHARFWSVRDLYSVPREAIGYVAYAMRRPDERDVPEAQD